MTARSLLATLVLLAGDAAAQPANGYVGVAGLVHNDLARGGGPIVAIAADGGFAIEHRFVVRAQLATGKELVGGDGGHDPFRRAAIGVDAHTSGFLRGFAGASLGIQRIEDDTQPLVGARLGLEVGRGTVRFRAAADLLAMRVTLYDPPIPELDSIVWHTGLDITVGLAIWF
jgi:hypothetical protein